MNPIDVSRGVPHAGPVRPGAADPPVHRVTLFTLANDVLRRRRLVVGVAAVSVVVAAALSLTRQRTYTTRTTFVAQARKPESSVGGLAAQLGLTVAPADAMQNPQFYLDLLTSRAILGGAVDAAYSFRSDTGPVNGTLVEIYAPREPTPALRRDAAIGRLRANVDATVSPKTGVVTLSVVDRHPALAQLIARRMLVLLNDYNRNTRKSQARAEREFTEQRFGEAKAELRAAEDRLQAFMQRNREYRNSPVLVLEEERLSREVASRQQTFAALSQAYDQARIDEVRDTPVISVIEGAEVPLRPDPRGTVRNTVVALLGGALLGALIALFSAHLARLRASTAADFAEFSDLKREAMRDFVRPHRSLARLIAGVAGGGRRQRSMG